MADPLSTWATLASQWPTDVWADWVERAAIMQYDGGLTQYEAEREAYRRIQSQREKAQ